MCKVYCISVPAAVKQTSTQMYCAVFSLEPLAQDPGQSEITDMPYVNLFTPLPLHCSVLTEA
jgi:hypothetical protein